jgi:hypothetical protein
LRKQYGLSRAEFEAIKTQQDNQCAICREDLSRTGPYPGLVVDQGDERGALRALLCQQCHDGIESFEGNPGILEAAWRYVVDVCGA